MAYFGMRLKDAGGKITYSSEWGGLGHNIVDASVTTAILQGGMYLRVGEYSFVGDLATMESGGCPDLLCAIRPILTYPAAPGILVEHNLGGTYLFKKQLIYTYSFLPIGGTGTINFRMILPRTVTSAVAAFSGLKSRVQFDYDVDHMYFGAGAYKPCEIVSDNLVNPSISSDFVNAGADCTVVDADSNYFLLGTDPDDFAPLYYYVGANTASIFVVRKDGATSAEYRMYLMMLEKRDSTTVRVQPCLIKTGFAGLMGTSTKYENPPPEGITLTTRLLEIAA